MQTIPLADTGRRTTRLGFGCSSLMGSMGRRQSLQTLEWAYDAGVRHFDVAPMYGFGAAEACLGEFLQRHAGDVTVTTKFGIPPARNTGWISVARSFARPLLKMVPSLKARAQRAANTVAAAPAARNLSPVEARHSLENSLRLLRVERIDVFLLHDATLEEVRGAELLDFLQKAKQDGMIGTFGVGTDKNHAAAILHEAPDYAPVLQQEWSVFDGAGHGGAFQIHHRALAHNRNQLQGYLQSNPHVERRWSAEIGTDLQRPGTLSELMMRAALQMNAHGIVLFSSKSRDHIQANAVLAGPSSTDAMADTLYRLVQSEAATIRQGNTA